MSKRIFIICQLLFLVTLLGHKSAKADLYQIQFTGTISRTSDLCPNEPDQYCAGQSQNSFAQVAFPYGGTSRLGQSYSATFLYDTSDANPTLSDSSGFVTAKYSNAIIGFSANSDSFGFQGASSGSCCIYMGSGTYSMIQFQGNGYIGDWDFQMNLLLFDYFGGRVLNSLDIPIDISNFGSYPFNFFNINFYKQDRSRMIEAQGSIDAINITPAIPEPSTYALMALGLAAVAYAARRRKPLSMSPALSTRTVA